jgi:sugar phosphate isomerase/epimerase
MEGAMDSRIKLGICVSPDKAAQVAEGYDYLELSASSVLMPLEDDAAYAPQQAQLQALRQPVRAFNNFVLARVRLVGPEVDWDTVSSYAERAIRRAAALGGRVIVFGSGGARTVPEGFSRVTAWEQLVRFLNVCADHASTQGVTIAIEPLNRRESNIINSYLEAAQLAKDVARESVAALADIYHFVMEEEPIEDIVQEADWLAHVHLADTGRLHPGSGVYPLERWFAILKDVGYTGMASVECSWGDSFSAETAQSLRFLRELVS